MCDPAELVHHIAGRMRLRIPAAKGNAAKLREIQRSLPELAGVQSVEANAMLGTLVVRYDPKLFTSFTASLTEFAREHSLFAIAGQNAAPCVSNADRSLNRFLGSVNRAVQAGLGNAINLKELLPLAVGVYALFFVDKAVAAAQWLNWIQFAIDSYVDLHENEPVEELGQTMEALFADLLAQHAQSTDALRAEMAALRTELRAVSDKIGTQPGT